MSGNLAPRPFVLPLAFGVIVCALSLDCGGVTFAQAPSSDSRVIIVKGQLMMVAESVYVVKDGDGKGVLIQVTPATKVDRTVKVGEVVEARILPSREAVSIQRAQ